jgi:hypothetical protein
MRVLDQLDEFPFIENPLLIKHSENLSNGKSFTHYKLTQTSHDFMNFMRRDQGEYLVFSPMPDELILMSNTMMREYEIGRHNQKRAHFPPFDKQAFYNESMKCVRMWKREGKNIDPLFERLEEYRSANQLTSTPQTWKDTQRDFKSGIRRFFGLSQKKRKKRSVSVKTFPSMIEALRDEATSRKSNIT